MDASSESSLHEEDLADPPPADAALTLPPTSATTTSSSNSTSENRPMTKTEQMEASDRAAKKRATGTMDNSNNSSTC